MKVNDQAPYYTPQTLEAAASYWEVKDQNGVKLDRDILKAMVEKYILENNTCALATGAGEFVRCTPIEYSYHDGCFWMFSEGGEKFRALAQNPRVCLAVFSPYNGFGSLHGIQVTGVARLIQPFSQEYKDHAAWKNLSMAWLEKLNSPMHLICVRPTRMDCLFSDFKDLECSPRQSLILDQED